MTEPDFEELPTPKSHKRQFSTTVHGSLLDALLAAAQVDGCKPQELVANFVRAGLRKRLKDDDRVSGYVRGVTAARAQRAIEEAAETEQLVEARRRRKSFKVVDGG